MAKWALCESEEGAAECNSGAVIVELPAELPISAIELRPNTVVGVSRSPFTGHSQVYRWPGQWWEATVTLPPMHWETAKQWAAFLLSLNGPEVAFTLPLHRTFRSTGLTGGAAHGWAVGTGAQVGSAWLPVGKWDSMATGAPHIGDYLYVPLSVGGDCLYQVTGGVVTDGAGDVTGMNVWPRLREAVAGHSFAFLAQGTFRLKAAPIFSLAAARVMEGLTLELIDAARM